VLPVGTAVQAAGRVITETQINRLKTTIGLIHRMNNSPSHSEQVWYKVQPINAVYDTASEYHNKWYIPQVATVL